MHRFTQLLSSTVQNTLQLLNFFFKLFFFIFYVTTKLQDTQSNFKSKSKPIGSQFVYRFLSSSFGYEYTIMQNQKNDILEVSLDLFVCFFKRQNGEQRLTPDEY